MVDTDTSIYKNIQAPDPLAQVGKLQSLQQGAQAIQSNQINISKQQLDLANERFKNVIRDVNSVPPEAGLDDYFKMGQNMVNQGVWTPENYSNFVDSLPTDPKQLPAFKQQFLAKAMSAQEMVNWHYGQQGSSANGQTVTPTLSSNRPGFAGSPTGGVVPNGLPIQQQVPPTAGSYDQNNQPRLMGPQSPQNAPGTVSQPSINTRPLPVGPGTSPAIPGQSSNFGGNVIASNVEPPQQLPYTPRGPAVGATPLFEEGKKAYTEDQNLATQKLTAIKPALQALPLIKGLTTGVGTETYNKALAGLSNLGLLPQGMTDKVAAFQEINKKLANYVSSNPVGQRSDAAQTLAEASSPSPKAQINPALIKLTKDAIALDRAQALRPLAFTKPTIDANGQPTTVPETDFSKYGNHRATFPAQVDELALQLDILEPKERQDLLDTMKKNKDTPQGKKFWNTLNMAVQSHLFDY